MIPKQNRITGQGAKYILKKGKKLNNTYFNIKFIRGSANENRFAVMVSLKVSPKAIERNKIRRQIYEIVRLSHLKSTNPQDIVIITKPNIKELDFQTLETSLSKALQKINE